MSCPIHQILLCRSILHIPIHLDCISGIAIMLLWSPEHGSKQENPRSQYAVNLIHPKVRGKQTLYSHCCGFSLR